MPKICKHNECNYPVFGKGYCKRHQWLRTDKKQKELKRTPVKKVSGKQQKINVVYSVMNKQFLKDNPLCGVRSDVCTHTATEVHHKNGRGKNTLDTTTWVAICRYCHNWIHFVNPKEARKQGFLK